MLLSLQHIIFKYQGLFSQYSIYEGKKIQLLRELWKIIFAYNILHIDSGFLKKREREHNINFLYERSIPFAEKKQNKKQNRTKQTKKPIS